MSTDPTSLLNQEVHFLGPITVPTSTSMFTASASMTYGDTLTVTEDVLEAGYDRRRAHWLELVDDEPAQIERYGEVKFGLGPFPEWLPRDDPHGPTLAQMMEKPYRQRIENFDTSLWKPDPIEASVSWRGGVQ